MEKKRRKKRKETEIDRTHAQKDRKQTRKSQRKNRKMQKKIKLNGIKHSYAEYIKNPSTERQKK